MLFILASAEALFVRVRVDVLIQGKQVKP